MPLPAGSWRRRHGPTLLQQWSHEPIDSIARAPDDEMHGSAWEGIGMISVKMANKTFGGYDAGTYDVTVGYADTQRTPQDAPIDFEAHPEYARRVAAMLLDQVAPVPITVWGEDEPIVHESETIARLHVKTIIENWDWIEWDGTPWANAVAKLNAAYARAHYEPVEVTSDITIEITMDSPFQQGGTVRLRPDAAAWVGARLLALSEGLTTEQRSTLHVERSPVDTEE